MFSCTEKAPRDRVVVVYVVVEGRASSAVVTVSKASSVKKVEDGATSEIYSVWEKALKTNQGKI
jgi:hypothetical protein